MKKIFFTFLLFSLSLFSKDKPFDVSTSLSQSSDGKLFLTVNYSIAPGHHIYFDMMSIDVPEKVNLIPRLIPSPIVIKDPLTGEKREMYTNDFSAKYILDNVKKFPVNITVNYQGCDEKMCFMPVAKNFSLSLNNPQEKANAQNFKNITTSNNWLALAKKFKIVAKTSGYLNAEKFLAFINNAETGKESSDKNKIDSFFKRGILLSLILIILGGAALNLTPCVLPMIPINLAIIGAGAQSTSKTKGFLLGGIYGIGIALTYGILGLIVVLTGSQFGAINSSPIFNFAIAAVFIILSLAMFDIIMIDFTKYQHTATSGKIKKGTFFTAFFMGCVAALLAGACVAPVVIYVLLLAADLYAKGTYLALFLPFLLGIGMGFPWAFAGAGLSFLPKPGLWMTRVKYAFGILIIVFAFYYGYLGFSLLSLSRGEVDFVKNPSMQLVAALEKSLKENRPIIIDFWATWCKNCVAMEETTFKNQKVIEKIQPYIFAKIQAEHPNREPEKSILNFYSVPGLPTYVILKPIKQK